MTYVYMLIGKFKIIWGDSRWQRVGGRGVDLSPRMHQEYIYRCNNSHRTPAEN